MITSKAEDMAEDTILLDQIHEEFLRGDTLVALDRLFAELRDLRARKSTEGWLEFAKQTAIEHPLREAIHREPMVCHSFEKPRGYAGDAELIDYIYRVSTPEGVSEQIREAYDYCTTARPASLAVQTRRRVVARAIDELVHRPRGLRRALAVACGHLREAELSRALAAGEIDEVVALDADELSLARARREYGELPIEWVHASISRLIRERDPGSFDLVYSSGLYDYLEDRIATKLTSCLFERLRPGGGKLLICNFVPQIYDAAFMESYMGWDLIYRSREEFEALACQIPTSEIASCRTWIDAHDAVVYLELTKA